MSEILRWLVKNLTPDENYFLGNKENLQQPIQVKLSKKLKVFFSIFYCISEIYI